jgi:hypothetical protein
MMYTHGNYYKIPVPKDITKTGKCQLCGESLTDLHHILGRDSHNVVRYNYGIELLRYQPFMIELCKSCHARKNDPKTRSQIVQHVYDTYGTDGLCALITFADVLGTYPKEKLAAIELLERTRK